MRVLIFIVVLVFGSALQANAGEDNTVQHEGGAVVLHILQQTDMDGVLRGALEFRSEQGWKTYWRDPGPVGIPPTLSFSMNGQPVESRILFPFPQWLSDDYATYAGYEGPISLPFEINVPDGIDENMTLSASLFAGVCQTVCIPISATFEIARTDGYFATALGSAMHITQAFDAIPQPISSSDLIDDIQRVDENSFTVSFTDTIKSDYLFASLERDGQVLVSLLPPQKIDSHGNTFRFEVGDAQTDIRGAEVILAALLGGQAVQTRFLLKEKILR